MLNIFGVLDENLILILILILYLPVVFMLNLLSKLIKLLYSRIKNRYLKSIPVPENQSIKIYAFIFSYYFSDRMPIVCGRGMIGNLHYNIYKTTDGMEVYRVQLDFNTNAHIVCVSKECNIDKTSLENYLLINNMEIVALEGNFSNQFDIYVSKNQNGITQYVIDPEVMLYIQTNLNEDMWEMSDNDLYVIHHVNNLTPHNNDKISKFIDQIRPAFYKATKRQWSDAGETPYGGYEDKIYLCPLCNKTLIKNKYWFECPDYDGIMINSRHLIKINDNEIQPPKITNPPKTHGTLKCPNCQNELTPTNYQNGKIVIDSCTKCTIRWLDSGEINRIAPNSSKKGNKSI